MSEHEDVFQPINLQERRRWLEPGQEPKWPYYIEFADGRRAEAVSPHYIMDLIAHEYFSDLHWGSDQSEHQTFYLLCVKCLRDIASGHLAMQGIRARVYDGVGPFYDTAVSRYKDEEEEEGELEFQNPDTPVVLDGWDPWTVVASLIRAGYIKLYEKYPTWSGEGPVRKKVCEGCVFNARVYEDEGRQWVECRAWDLDWAWREEEKKLLRNCPYVTHGAPYIRYHEVKPEELPDPADWKPDWTPPELRKKEYIGFRRRLAAEQGE